MSYRHKEVRKDFSGGYNSRDSDSMLQPNESPDMLNVIVGRRGTVRPRPGTEQFRTDPVSDPLVEGEDNPPVTSLYEFVNQAGQAYLFAFAGQSLKKANDSNGWDLVQGSFSNHSLFEFITHPIEDKALFVNGEDGYWETDGNTASLVTPYVTSYHGVVDTNGTAVTWVSGSKFSSDWVGDMIVINDVAYEIDSVTNTENLVLTGSAGVQNDVDYDYYTDDGIEVGESVLPSNPKLIEYFSYTVWLANVDGYPNRIYYNLHDLNGNILYNYFASWSWLRASNIKGEEITALKAFRGVLYVFTRTTIKAITETEPFSIVGEVYTPPAYEMTDVSSTVGTVSQRTVQEIGNSLIFLGVDGVYMFDGQSAPFKVSQRVEPTFVGARRRFWNQSCGAVHNNKYFVSFPTSVREEDDTFGFSSGSSTGESESGESEV